VEFLEYLVKCPLILYLEVKMLQKQVPMFICFLMGLLLFFQFYIPASWSQNFYNTILRWILGISSFAIVLGVVSLIRHHLRKIRKKEDLPYSITLIFSIFVTTLIGFIGGIKSGTLFDKIFNYIQIPLQSSMFAILAFYMASAAYRAFRARNVEATLLLLSAFVVMIGVIGIGDLIHPFVPSFAQWILDVPNLAAKRGIAIGVGLGIIATSIKIILGIERNWLGR
jgi:MFS family permease